ncbi:MAG: hypothetical protein ACOCW2_00645 [Chitinivibrionales bacterium]
MKYSELLPGDGVEDTQAGLSRRIVIYSGADHSREPVSQKVKAEVKEWFEHHLLEPMIERS